MAFQKPLTVRLAALHKAALSLGRAFSIELMGCLGRQVGQVAAAARSVALPQTSPNQGASGRLLVARTDAESES